MSEAAVAFSDPPQLPGDRLFSDYPVAATGYDEMYSAPGILRPHWQDMARFLEGVGGVELERRYREIQRLLQADGVTYNTYDDPHGSQRHWLLDPVPLLVFSPGLYSISVDTAVSASPGVAVLSDTPQADIPVDIQTEPTAEFTRVVQEQVESFLTDCATQQVR